MTQNPICKYLRNYENIETYIHETVRATAEMSKAEKDVVDEALVMVIEKRVPCYIMRRRYYGLYRRLEGAEWIEG